MVFFLTKLTETIRLHPKHFGPKMKETLVKQLENKLNGNCTGRHGFVITTMYPKEEDISRGIIDVDTGFATFTIVVSAIVCRPFKGEVIDAVVSTVNKMGFFADAGPLRIFVSHKLMPEDLEFVAGNEDVKPHYTNGIVEQSIKEDAAVRVRIVGTRVDTNQIFSIGTIKGDFLGIIAQI